MAILPKVKCLIELENVIRTVNNSISYTGVVVVPNNSTSVLHDGMLSHLGSYFEIDVSAFSFEFTIIFNQSVTLNKIDIAFFPKTSRFTTGSANKQIQIQYYNGSSFVGWDTLQSFNNRYGFSDLEKDASTPSLFTDNNAQGYVSLYSSTSVTTNRIKIIFPSGYSSHKITEIMMFKILDISGDVMNFRLNNKRDILGGTRDSYASMTLKDISSAYFVGTTVLEKRQKVYVDISDFGSEYEDKYYKKAILYIDSIQNQTELKISSLGFYDLWKQLESTLIDKDYTVYTNTAIDKTIEYLLLQAEIHSDFMMFDILPDLPTFTTDRKNVKDIIVQLIEACGDTEAFITEYGQIYIRNRNTFLPKYLTYNNLNTISDIFYNSFYHSGYNWIRNDNWNPFTYNLNYQIFDLYHYLFGYPFNFIKTSPAKTLGSIVSVGGGNYAWQIDGSTDVRTPSYDMRNPVETIGGDSVQKMFDFEIYFNATSVNTDLYIIPKEYMTPDNTEETIKIHWNAGTTKWEIYWTHARGAYTNTVMIYNGNLALSRIRFKFGFYFTGGGLFPPVAWKMYIDINNGGYTNSYSDTADSTLFTRTGEISEIRFYGSGAGNWKLSQYWNSSRAFAYWVSDPLDLGTGVAFLDTLNTVAKDNSTGNKAGYSMTYLTSTSADGITWEAFKEIISGSIKSTANRYIKVMAIFNIYDDDLGNVTMTLSQLTIVYGTSISYPAFRKSVTLYPKQLQYEKTGTDNGDNIMTNIVDIEVDNVGKLASASLSTYNEAISIDPTYSRTLELILDSNYKINQSVKITVTGIGDLTFYPGTATISGLKVTYTAYTLGLNLVMENVSVATINITKIEVFGEKYDILSKFKQTYENVDSQLNYGEIYKEVKNDYIQTSAMAKAVSNKQMRFATAPVWKLYNLGGVDFNLDLSLDTMLGIKDGYNNLVLNTEITSLEIILDVGQNQYDVDVEARVFNYADFYVAQYWGGGKYWGTLSTGQAQYYGGLT